MEQKGWYEYHLSILTNHIIARKLLRIYPGQYQSLSVASPIVISTCFHLQLFGSLNWRERGTILLPECFHCYIFPVLSCLVYSIVTWCGRYCLVVCTVKWKCLLSLSEFLPPPSSSTSVSSGPPPTSLLFLISQEQSRLEDTPSPHLFSIWEVNLHDFCFYM